MTQEILEKSPETIENETRHKLIQTINFLATQKKVDISGFTQTIFQNFILNRVSVEIGAAEAQEMLNFVKLEKVVAQGATPNVLVDWGITVSETMYNNKENNRITLFQDLQNVAGAVLVKRLEKANNKDKPST